MRNIFTGQYDCKTASKQLDAFLDGELTTKQARDLSAHLATCRSCQEALKKRKELREAFHAETENATVPYALHDAVMRRISEEKQRSPALRLSRPATALVGSLCAVALVMGFLLSPLGELAMKGDITMEDAMAGIDRPNSAAPESPREDSDDHVSDVDGTVDKSEASTLPTTPVTYGVTNSEITVTLLPENAAKVTDGDGNRFDGTYKLDGNTLTVTLSKNTAIFKITEDGLDLKSGKLFD